MGQPDRNHHHGHALDPCGLPNHADDGHPADGRPGRVPHPLPHRCVFPSLSLLSLQTMETDLTFHPFSTVLNPWLMMFNF